jgi:hypothetical protein
VIAQVPALRRHRLEDLRQGIGVGSSHPA